MIEKWRPAKVGDVGIVRVRHCSDANWVVLLNAKVDSVGRDAVQLHKGGRWHFCEVLEAYMSDEEVERLAGLTEQAIVKASIKNAANIAGSIRQHFASEEGGE